jgi:HD-like signal output (HDOD) protein
LLAGVVGIAVLTYRLRVRRTAVDAPTAADPAAQLPEAPADAPSDDPPYSTDATEAVQAECYNVAFGVARFDYQILGEHAAVMERVAANAAQSVHQREYFPRRPMLLPKLMQALNDTESTRRSLVKLIVEDPSLAGSVLQRANNALYRTSREPVDSLDRAVQTLGIDGLRALMATAILQPVFRLPKGYFDNFAPVTWEQAQRCAAAAEAYATATRSADPFVAQLLGLLGALARIVLFRLTMDMYREQPHVLPRAEVFIRSMQLHGPATARLIAQTWELSDLATTALSEQAQRISPAHMRPLGRAVYFGELCGPLTLLATRKSYSVDTARTLLEGQGLPSETVNSLWQAAWAAGRDS